MTYITLVGAVGFDVTAHKQAAYEAVAFQRVDSRCKRQNGSLVRRGELHLGKVVDEEVEFGGHAAQTGLDQPDKMRKVYDQSCKHRDASVKSQLGSQQQRRPLTSQEIKAHLCIYIGRNKSLPECVLHDELV